jgi:hypothetical protein
MPNLRIGAFVGLLALALLATACNKEPETLPAAGEGGQSAVAGSAEATGGSAVSANQEKPLRVKILPTTPTAGDDLRASVSGVVSRVAFRWEINGSEVQAARGSLLPKGNFAKGDLVTVVADSGGRETRAETTVANSPPEILSVEYSPPVVRRGTDLVARPQVEDPDGDRVGFSFRWYVNGEERPLPDTPVLPGDKFAKGDRIAVEVVPEDGESTGAAYRTGDIEVANAPPRFVTTPPASFRAATYVYRARAEDADGDPLSYALESGPEGMTVDEGSGEVRWTVGKDQAGEHTVRITVDDGDGRQDVQEFRLEITISE